MEILNGYFFHTLDPNGKIERQGSIVGAGPPGYYLVEFFDWITGDFAFCKLEPVEAVATWWLYPDRETFVFSYEHGAASQRNPRAE